jgi:RimJ/RimL family protein N-acetyltransferase
MTEVQPTLRTARLVLRPFVRSDAADIQRLVGVREVAEMTANIPHPYPDGAAESWIRGLEHSRSQGIMNASELVFAITDAASGAMLGAVGLVQLPAHARAELGYWVARDSWGQGYATEAACAVLEFGFGTLGLERIDATYMTGNPASARVMQKLGMVFEGLHPRLYRRDGVFRDSGRYAILRDAWLGTPQVVSEPAWKRAVRTQFGAALESLERAIAACPEPLWSECREGAGAFGDMAFHTLFWADYYLSAQPDGFAPPAPFGLEELDDDGLLPPRVHAKGELGVYLAHVRRKAIARIGAMDETLAGTASGFLDAKLTECELLLYNARHVQHHVGQMQLLLRQHGVEPPRWVRASEGLG